MEPKLPLSDRRPESRPADPALNREAQLLPSSPEISTEQSAERREHQNETAPPAESVRTPVLASPTSAAPPLSSDDIATLPQVSDDMPAVANDDELIEKEWVDKAKQVIAETRDDPYRREQEVSKLQADYLFKRYGRKLGSRQ